MDKQELLSVLSKQIIKEEKRVKETKDVSNWINGYSCGRVDALTFGYEKVEQLDGPENPVVPKEFDEWYKEIQERYVESLAKRFAVWKICQFEFEFGQGFKDARNKEVECETLINWIDGHKEEAIDAVLNGYTVKEPVWVVHLNDIGCKETTYLDKFREGWKSNTPFYYVTLVEEKAHKFTDKQKAEAVATLVDGTVEKWSE